MNGTDDTNILEIGAHLDNSAPIESVRCVGPKPKVELKATALQQWEL